MPQSFRCCNEYNGCLPFLTPSLPQPVKFPGWKVREQACKQYIFWSYNKYDFNSVRFGDWNPFTYYSEKEKKKTKGF